MRRIIIGVMGGGQVSDEVWQMAYELGQRIADEGWVLLNGGRAAGVMDASAQGARANGGLTVGVLPGDSQAEASAYIDIPIVTGLGSARNNVNVLSSDVVVACPGGAGTLSEVALALKAGRPVILLNFEVSPVLEVYATQGLLHRADNPAAAIAQIHGLLGQLFRPV